MFDPFLKPLSPIIIDPTQKISTVNDTSIATESLRSELGMSFPADNNRRPYGDGGRRVNNSRGYDRDIYDRRYDDRRVRLPAEGPDPDPLTRRRLVLRPELQTITPGQRPVPSEHGDSAQMTRWVLRLDTKQHKCADADLFRQPFSPEPITMEDDSVQQPTGTVVLPIKPGPQTRYGLDISVMTISNVLHDPTARTSEMSWPVLEKQGFELNQTSPYDTGSTTMARTFAEGMTYAVQHPNLPGVNLLYASRSENERDRLLIWPVRVNMERWKAGIEYGVLGRAVDMEGTLAVTQVAGNSRFQAIVQGRTRVDADMNILEGDDDVTILLH